MDRISRAIDWDDNDISIDTMDLWREEVRGGIERIQGIIKSDTTHPATPVVIDGGDYTGSSDTLKATWSSSDEESGIWEYQYSIGRSPDETGVLKWTSAGTRTSVIQTGLDLLPDQTYYFSVKSKNGAGFWSETGYSDGIYVDHESPSLPAEPRALAASSTRIFLEWNVSMDNIGIEGYRIFRDDVLVGTTKRYCYTDIYLDPLTTYEYRISAYDLAGNESEKSSIIFVTTKDAPEQFRIWASTSKEYPPLPVGWERLNPEEGQGSSVYNFMCDYVIFSRAPSTPVFQETIPEDYAITDTLYAFASLGEYEPITFSVFALKDLENIFISVSDLEDENNNIISEDYMDLRTVGFTRRKIDEGLKTYILYPHVLEKKNLNRIEQGTSKRYWLTLKVPENAVPGIYKGAIEFYPSNAERKSIPIHLRILPYRLLEADITRFMWSRSNKQQFKNGFTREKMYIDMREHGMTTSLFQADVLSRDQNLGEDDIHYMIEQIEDYWGEYTHVGFRDNPIGGINNNQIIYYWDNASNWFKFWPTSSTMDSQFTNAYSRIFLEEGIRKGWPNFLHYIVDEPGAHPETLDPTCHYLTLFKTTFPGLKSFITIGGGTKIGYNESSLLGPNLDVTCTNYFIKEIIDNAMKNQSELWIYNGGSKSNDPLKDRFFFGFYCWKTCAKGIGQWVYSWEDSFKIPFQNENYCNETEDGYLPTIAWEMVREGVDDLNYIYSLYSLIEFAKMEHPEAMDKINEAMDDLKDILLSINLFYRYGIDVPDPRFQMNLSYEELQYCRWVIANHIDSLMKYINLNDLESVPPEYRKHQRSLSEEDWQVESSMDKKQWGPNLFINSGFEVSPSDWRNQIWAGNGLATIDGTISYTGEKSSRLVGGDNITDNTVTVYLNPDIILKADETYRFSAMIRAEDVLGYANLYAAIRSGGLDDVKSDILKGTFDWKEVSLQFTPNEDSKAEYFAVRLWGPGTLWVDNIELRPLLEFIEINTNKKIFYGSDKDLTIMIKTNEEELNCDDLRIGLLIKDSSDQIVFGNEYTQILSQIREEVDLQDYLFGDYTISATAFCDSKVLAHVEERIKKVKGPFDEGTGITGFPIQLYKGYNSFALGLNLEYKASDCLAYIRESGIDCVQIIKYDHAAESWMIYDINIPEILRTDFVLENGKGYFAYCNSEGFWIQKGKEITLPITIHINKGYTSVSIPPSVSSINKASDICNVDSSIKQVIKFDRIKTAWITYDRSIPEFLIIDFDITPGEGYFVYSKKSFDWVVGSDSQDGNSSVPKCEQNFHYKGDKQL